jgi:hypothetical protein
MPKCNIRKAPRKKPKTKLPSDWLRKKKTAPCCRDKERYIMKQTINGGDCDICWNAITTFRGILNTKRTWKDHADMKRGPCDHVFCFKCIKEWSKKHNTCPTCRQTFTRVEKFNIQTQTSDEMLKVKKIQNERQSQVRLEFNEARLPSLEWRVGRRVRYIRTLYRHEITEGTIVGIVVGHGEQYNVEWDSNAVSRHTSFSRPQLQLLPEANTIVLD